MHVAETLAMGKPAQSRDVCDTQPKTLAQENSLEFAPTLFLQSRPRLDSSDSTSKGNSSSPGPSGSAGITRKPLAPQYDPASLLSPKALRQRPKNSPGQNDAASSQYTGSSSSQPNNFSSMIERMHHVQDRQDHPSKKLKRDHVLEETSDHKKAIFGNVEGGGALGNFFKENAEQAKPDSALVSSAPTIPTSATIDLTAEDDDEIIVISDNSAKEVCLGRLERPYINAFQVPQQKVGGPQGSRETWPAMKVSLRRMPGVNYVIHVVDPRGQAFGSLDSRTSAGLAHLLDGHETNGIRVSAMIEPRRKRPGEVAGQSIAEGVQIYLLLVLYAPRRHADHIGTVLSKKQLWLRMPPKFDTNTDYYNPQAPNVARTKISTGNGIIRQSAGPVGSGGESLATTTYVFRTVEEIRNDVITMFDSLTKTEDLPEKEQDSRITTKLLKHQKQALHFMTERETEHGIQEDGKEKHALWTVRSRQNGRKMYYNVITGYETSAKPPPVLGGILADMMGLGKTLSILSLIIDSLSAAEQWQNSPSTNPNETLSKTKATLLVSPVSTVANWEEQLKMHLKPGTLKHYVYHGSNRTKDFEELMKYDIVLTTYSVVAADFGNSKSKKPLLNINWFRIVLDEAHMIRTQSTRQSQAICMLSAQRRWAVTGTPVQNRLDDLGALIKFLRVRPFDEKGGFAQYILSPFKNADPEILPKLRLLVDSITLRRLKDKIDLPKRHDQIVRLEFTDDERKLYEWFAKDATSKVNAVTSERTRLGGRVYAHILRSILRLRLICAHGTELLSDEDMKLTEGLSYGNAIDLGDDEEEDRPALSSKQAYDMFHLLKESDMDTCSCCQKKLGQPDPEDETDGKAEDTIGYMTPCYQVVCPKCMPEFRIKVQERTTADNYMTCPICDQYVKVSFFELSEDKLEEDEQSRAKLRSNTRLTKQLTRYSGPHTKTIALIQSLLENQKWSDEHPDEPPIKSVIFSGWTTHLDLIEIALSSTSPPLPFTRLDGRMTRKDRSRALQTFSEDPSVPIILVSIAAGGLGLNLTTGSRVYVMEPQFNPAAEAQAVDRVHRLGQTREVVVSRFIMKNSFEEKMLELQRKKMQLAELSLSRSKLGRDEEQKRKMEDLRSLFR